MERTCDLFSFDRNCSERMIMVTLDGSVEPNVDQLSDWIRLGMTSVRINTGHDRMTDWRAMIEAVRNASELAGFPCSIYLDLSGPKIRLSSILSKRGKKKNRLKVSMGDRFFLSEEGVEIANGNGKQIYISEKGLLAELEENDPVIFDDGTATARVKDVSRGWVELEVERTKGASKKLKVNKGVAFPDKEINLPAFTELDRHILSELGELVDVVGVSFVQRPDDIRELSSFIRDKAWSHLGIVAKIETSMGFRRLPEILLALMETSKSGVMIARGDLALEVGAERLAEVQEEILWLCEAAMTPVIWATQVLESLTKEGVPTRAEITDAAMSSFAECVMLNKGAYIGESIRSLSEILKKIRAHRYKKTAEMRSLKLARDFFDRLDLSDLRRSEKNPAL